MGSRAGHNPPCGGRGSVARRERGAPHLGCDGSVAAVCCSWVEVLLMPHEHWTRRASTSAFGCPSATSQLSAALRTVKLQTHHQPTLLSPLLPSIYGIPSLIVPSSQQHSTNCRSDFLPSDALRARRISNTSLVPKGAPPRETWGSARDGASEQKPHTHTPPC